MQYAFCLAILLFLPIATHAQEENDLTPVTVSAIIGDTLDQAEREYFGFLMHPNRLEGFQHAIFLSAPNGKLAMKISRSMPGGNDTDTLIATGLSPRTLQETFLRRVRETEENHERGRIIYGTLRGGEEFSGELLAVENDAIAVSLEEEADYAEIALGTALSCRISREEIAALSIEGRKRGGRGARWGLLGGALLVPLVSYATGFRGDAGGYDLAAGAVGGLLTGLAIGAMASERDQVQDLTSSDGLTALRPYARFPELVPPFIRRIDTRAGEVLSKR